MAADSQTQRAPARGLSDEAGTLVNAQHDVTDVGVQTSTPPTLVDSQGFLDELDPTASGFRFRTFNDANDAPKDGGRKFHGKLAGVATELEGDNRSKRGVFVVINAGGDTDDSITSIRAVYADTDGAPLDPIMRCGLDPHIVVETSPGKWHAYWLVVGLAVDQFRGVQRRIAYRFGTDRKIINPSRVMRLPGFHHHKGESFRVRTIHESGKPAYTAEEVLEQFPLLAEFPDKARAKEHSAAAHRSPRGSVSSYADAALHRAAGNVASAADGSRNDTLNKEAYSLAGIAELTDAQIIAVLAPAARAAGLSDSEIDATIASGIASGRGRPREAPQPQRQQSGNAAAVDPGDPTDNGAARELPPPIFTHVDLRDLGNAKAELPRYIVDPLIAAGVVTMLGGHGGSGKTMLSLIIGAHVALGRPWGPFVFDKGRVLFVSLEDPGKRIRATLARVCEHHWLDPRAVSENFTIIDGTAVEAALAAEFSVGYSGKQLVATAAYAELLALAAGFDLIIIDNASDAFDGNENERRQVRKFVRGMLGGIARAHDCAVLLLAHIDKSAAKFGAKKNSYSGSTAWHNSARSRLAIIDDEKTGLELVQEKNNLGKKAEPLQLVWTDSGMLVPGVAGTTTDTSEADALTAGTDDEAVFAAIQSVIGKGDSITTSKLGSCNTHNLLAKHDALPKYFQKVAGKERFWAALARLQRAGRLVVEEYENAYRHPRERWAIPVEVAACERPL